MSAEESEPEDHLAFHSPRLKPVKVKLQQSPSPQPFPTKEEVKLPRASIPEKPAKYRKPRATFGDTVLVNSMSGGNQPIIAQIAGSIALKTSDSASESEEGWDDDDMEDMDTIAALKIEASERANRELGNTNLRHIAQTAMSIDTSEPTSKPRDIDARRDSGKPPDNEMSPSEGLKGLNLNFNDDEIQILSKRSTQTSIVITESKKWSAQSYGPEESLITSPLSAHLKGPESPAQKLPALQHGSPKEGPGSPQTTLPSVGGLIEIADKTNENAAEELRRRQSSFSTSTSHPFSAQSARSPAALPPLSHTSPTLTQSDTTSPRDFRSQRSPPTGISSYFFAPRRASAASETSPPSGFPANLPSASTSSTDGTSPSTQPTPSETHRMSVDGVVAVGTPVILPPPVPTLAAGLTLSNIVPLAGPAAQGPGYKCEYPGCTAAPFQTQYLLKYVSLPHRASLNHH